MRCTEDKKLREEEIKIWFQALQRAYIREGQSVKESSKNACEEVGRRFNLRGETIYRYKNSNTTTREEKYKYRNEALENFRALKKIMQIIEKDIECE